MKLNQVSQPQASKMVWIGFEVSWTVKSTWSFRKKMYFLFCFYPTKLGNFLLTGFAHHTASAMSRRMKVDPIGETHLLVRPTQNQRLTAITGREISPQNWQQGLGPNWTRPTCHPIYEQRKGPGLADLIWWIKDHVHYFRPIRSIWGPLPPNFIGIHFSFFFFPPLFYWILFCLRRTTI